MRHDTPAEVTSSFVDFIRVHHVVDTLVRVYTIPQKKQK